MLSDEDVHDQDYVHDQAGDDDEDFNDYEKDDDDDDDDQADDDDLQARQTSIFPNGQGQEACGENLLLYSCFLFIWFILQFACFFSLLFCLSVRLLLICVPVCSGFYLLSCSFGITLVGTYLRSFSVFLLLIRRA